MARQPRDVLGGDQKTFHVETMLSVLEDVGCRIARVAVCLWELSHSRARFHSVLFDPWDVVVQAAG